jgi:hypothetical protein
MYSLLHITDQFNGKHTLFTLSNLVMRYINKDLITMFEQAYTYTEMILSHHIHSIHFFSANGIARTIQLSFEHPDASSNGQFALVPT